MVAYILKHHVINKQTASTQVTESWQSGR